MPMKKNKIKSDIFNWIFFQARRKYKAEEMDLTCPAAVLGGGQASWGGDTTEVGMPLREAMTGS